MHNEALLRSGIDAVWLRCVRREAVWSHESRILYKMTYIIVTSLGQGLMVFLRSREPLNETTHCLNISGRIHAPQFS